MSSLLDKCNKLGLKMTEQRKVIVQVLADSKDHPDVELVYKRASEKDKNIGIATVYRTIRLFEENNDFCGKIMTLSKKALPKEKIAHGP